MVDQGQAGTSAGGTSAWTLAAACAGTFILLVNVTIVVVALPDLATDLDAGLTTTRWVIASYALALSALLLGAGTLADLLGHRRVFLAGLALFLAASALCGSAWSPAMLLTARTIQGAAAALLFSTSLALIAGAYPGHRRAWALGVWAATVGVATTLGPLLGGFLVQWLSWRWVFFVNLPAGAAAAAIALLKVADSRPDRTRGFDWRGQLLAAGGLLGVVYALGAAGGGSWARAAVLLPLAGGFALLAAFIGQELRAREPMLDPRLLARPGIAGAALAGFTLHGTFFALYVFLTVWMQGVRGYSAILTGLVLVPAAAMSVLLGPLAGRLAARAAPAARVAAGLTLVAAGVWSLRAVGPDSSWSALLPGFVLGGAGVGIANPAIAGAALAVIEPARAGLAAAINTTSRQLGTAVGVAGLGTLLETRAEELAEGRTPPELARETLEKAADGRIEEAGREAPAELRDAVTDIGRAAYSGGLDDALAVAAVLAVAGALGAGLLLRRAARPGEATPLPGRAGA